MKKTCFLRIAALCLLPLLLWGCTDRTTVGMLMIGDSRTLGLAEQAELPDTHFFASVGLRIRDASTVSVSVPQVGKLGLSELLRQQNYGKICVMLGINELEYPLSDTAAELEALTALLRQLQPDADLILLGNLHVTQERSSRDPICNNPAIDRLNHMIRETAREENLGYLDPNSWSDDAFGALDPEKCSDNAHLTAASCREWGRWLQVRLAYIRKEDAAAP